MPSSELDIVLALLLVVLGALVTYTLDEIFAFTPRLSNWIGRLLGEN